MFKTWKLGLFFLLCLMFALLLNLPIKQVLPLVKLPNTVSLIGINGTAFNGTVQEININSFPLRSLDYRYQPSCILLLKVCYNVSYEQGIIEIGYDVLNGDTEISYAKVEYPVSELVRHVPNVPVNPVGRIELVIDDLSMVRGKPVALSGKLTWRDMGLDDDIKINLGDYQIIFAGDQQKYDFKLTDLDASLDVGGAGNVRADGQYSVDIKIASEDSIEPRVKNVLDLVAAKTAYNQYRFEQKGRLPASITRQLFR